MHWGLVERVDPTHEYETRSFDAIYNELCTNDSAIYADSGVAKTRTWFVCSVSHHLGAIIFTIGKGRWQHRRRL